MRKQIKKNYQLLNNYCALKISSNLIFVFYHHPNWSSNYFHEMQLLVQIYFFKAKTHLLITVNLFRFTNIIHVISPIKELFSGSDGEGFSRLWDLTCLIFTSHYNLKVTCFRFQHVFNLNWHYVWRVAWREVNGVGDEWIFRLEFVLMFPISFTHYLIVLVYYDISIQTL